MIPNETGMGGMVCVDDNDAALGNDTLRELLAGVDLEYLLDREGKDRRVNWHDTLSLGVPPTHLPILPPWQHMETVDCATHAKANGSIGVVRLLCCHLTDGAGIVPWLLQA